MHKGAGRTPPPGALPLAVDYPAAADPSPTAAVVLDVVGTVPAALLLFPFFSCRDEQPCVAVY